MPKTAKKRLQIVTVDGKSAGAIHADDGKSRALCGASRRAKRTTRWKSLGGGKVTCGSCKRHT